MRIPLNQGLSYDDVLLTPKKTSVKSLSDVHTSTEIAGLELSVPVMSAAMDTVTEKEFAIELAQLGGLGVLHRFMSADDQAKQVREVKKSQVEGDRSATDEDGDLVVGAALGLHDEERARKLVEESVDALVIDIAHGHHETLLQKLEYYAKKYSDTVLIAGNVATAKAAQDLEEAGADAAKVGIGPGCFAADTRILMAGGIYKNISEVERGERVINKRGEPVEVLSKKSKGVRKVSKLNHNKFYQSTFVTSDHDYWTGDTSSLSKSTLSNGGYASVLETKTRSGRSKYKWMQIQSAKDETLSLPSDIKFDLQETFEIQLDKRSGGNWRSGYEYESDEKLKPSYELGYIFGTYLGDGSARVDDRGSGQIQWNFNRETEREVAEKVAKCVKEVFDKEIPIREKQQNLVRPVLYYTPFARFLEQEFGKRQDKHLPSNYFVEDEDYLLGLYEGLIDSDGHIEKDGRRCFNNTSKRLIELFGVLCHILFDGFPNFRMKKKSAGNLEGTSLENLSQGYVARYNNITSKRITLNGYQVVKPLEYEHETKKVEVFDIEVDCETHSFIAGNAIVHNSACTTREMTGVGVPQFTAVRECAEAVEVPVIADGGIRKPGDLAKAVMAGASVGMMGGMFAGTEEAPGKFVQENGENYKKFRGMSSREAAERRAEKEDRELKGSEKISEGDADKVEYKGALKDIIVQLKGGLSSSISYCGADNIQEARENAEFIEVTSATQYRNGSHMDSL